MYLRMYICIYVYICIYIYAYMYTLVLGTMLHELCHIVHGPHNDKFYSLLEELRVEAEELIDKGVAGLGAFECEGFRGLYT